VDDERLQIHVDGCLVDGFVKLFGYPGQLRDQAQSVDDEADGVVRLKQFVLLDYLEAGSVHEVLGERLECSAEKTSLEIRVTGQ